MKLNQQLLCKQAGNYLRGVNSNASQFISALANKFLFSLQKNLNPLSKLTPSGQAVIEKCLEK